MTGRLPDFVVIGAMKAATTSLFRWLQSHPDAAMPRVKEPTFFSHDERWDHGLDWYRSLFPPGPGLTGEASPSYTWPDRAATSAERLQSVLPEAPLLFIARDPEERARSHYLHMVRRGTEHQPFPAALAEPGNPYAETSCYARCLAPWLDGPTADRLLVVRFEDLTGPDETTWQEVLTHLGLAAVPRPAIVDNAAADLPHDTALMRAFRSRGWHRHLRRRGAPWVRKLGRRFFVRDTPAADPLVASARQPAPAAVRATWAEDADALAARLGWASPIWEPTGSA